MGSFVRAPKDFWTGVIYLVVGALGYWIGRDYSFGSAGRMGPGYFPFAISCLLLLFGVITLVRSFLTDGEPVGALAFKPIVLAIGGVIAFGYLLPRTGLIVAMLVMVLLSAAASEKFRFEWRAVAGLVGSTRRPAANSSITALIGRVTSTSGSPREISNARRRNSSIIGPKMNARSNGAGSASSLRKR